MPYWAMLHPPKLCCSLLSYAALYGATLYTSELWWTLLSHAAPYWATMRPTELYTAPTEPRYALLSYAAPFMTYAASYGATMHPYWAELHPCELPSFPALSELGRTLLRYCTLHPPELHCALLTELPCPLLSYYAQSGKRCTLLRRWMPEYQCRLHRPWCWWSARAVIIFANSREKKIKNGSIVMISGLGEYDS